MGKLNIAHHKSYHPYRRDNIERVRRDEEQARLDEAAKEGKIMLADAEARISLLRQRAGSSAQTELPLVETHTPRSGPSSLTAGGHINLFEDLELQTVEITRKVAKKDPITEEGFPLAPSEKDRKPWYSDRDHEKNKEVDGDRRIRELARKAAHDPLTSINQQLARRSGDDTTRPNSSRRPPPRGGQQRPPESERLSRESSERQRAMELIKRRQRELEGSATPSTVQGGMGGAYGDMYNRKEVEDAHRNRDRRGRGDERRWGNGR